MIFKHKPIRYIFFVSLAIGILFPLLNIYFIYPTFTDLLIKNTENEAIRIGRYLSDVYFHIGKHPSGDDSTPTDLSGAVNIEDSPLIHTIQTGSFKDMEQARKQFDTITRVLTDKDLEYLRIEKIGQYYTVRIGKFLDRVTAKTFLQSTEAQLPGSILMASNIKHERIKKSYLLPTDPIIEDGENRTVPSGAHSSEESFSEKRLLSKEEIFQLEDRMKKQISDFNIMKLKIFSPSGEIIYSTSKKDIGKINEKDYFHNIVSQGKPFTKVVNKDTPSLEGQTVKTDVVETYVPVMSDGKFIGAFEIYYNITERNAALNKAMLQSHVIFIAAMIIFLVVITLMLSRQDGSIFKQKQVESELVDLNEQLEGEIVERNRAEKELIAFSEKLEQSNRELESFAHIASHDLQEPLRKITAFGDRLHLKYSDKLDEKGMDYLDRMQSAARRMQDLIQGLLNFSRVKTKAQPFVPVDLGTVVKEVTGDLEVRIEQTGGKIEVGDLAMIDADPLQMRQLLQNLIGNALKFSKEDTPPLIKIHGDRMHNDNDNHHAHSDEEFYQIVVEDNGIGFEHEYAERIFGVFQRLHGRQEYEGTGMGLSICRKIVERHNGRIKAESAPGMGAAFIIDLPVKQIQGGNDGNEGESDHHFDG